MKKWKPAPREAVTAFETVTSGLAGAEARKMFGYPCVFAKGSILNLRVTLRETHGQDSDKEIKIPL